MENLEILTLNVHLEDILLLTSISLKSKFLQVQVMGD